MKLMLRYVRRHLGMFLTAIFFLTIETLADLLQPTFMSFIVDEGVAKRDVRHAWNRRAGSVWGGYAQYLCQQDLAADREGNAHGNL